MNLYKLTYTQESEAYVSAESEDEAREYITELTENGGGSKMNWVRLNECGWSVTEEYGKLEPIIEERYEDGWTDYTHETEDGAQWSQDGRLFWDQGE